jgi:Tol biopolymer transport system component
VADGSVQVLKSLDSFHRDWFSHNRSLSPDGRYVVYDRPVKDHGGASDIFILPTDGSGEEIPLVEHPADDCGPIWTPDGKGVIFVSDRSGTFDAWLIQVVDGKPVGGLQLVKREVGAMHPMGFTREGSLYYGLRAHQSDVYIATIDPATGELLAPPKTAIQQFEGFNLAPAWSPDGKSLAYISLRPSPRGSRRRPVLVIRSEETGEERELHPELRLRFRQPSLRWSPDGRSILCKNSLIDAQTGDVTPIVQIDPAGNVRQIDDSAWSRDGKAIFYLRVLEDWSTSIVMHNLETGKEEELCKGVRNAAGLAISPDGRQIAFASADGQSLMVIPTAGGEPRELLRLQGPEAFRLGRSFESTADGGHILFRKINQSSWLRELCRIPAEGGEPQKFMEVDGVAKHISAHPDGRRIALTYGQKEKSAEVWAMENFLPGFAADK